MSETERPDSTDNPRVSVITIFLNGEAFLAEAIESVIAQSFQDWEYLLVDDGSGPEATAIAKDYAARYPGRIRYLEHPDHVNRGMSATRNLGIRHVRGEFIAFIDADDVWLPTKLSDHVTLLDAHPEVGLVCGTTVYWHSWSDSKDDVVRTGHRQDVVINPPDATLSVYPLGEPLPPSFSDVVFRAKLVKRLGGFEEQFVGHYEDIVFLAKVFLSSPVYFCSAVSNKVRMHPASCTSAVFRDGKYREGRLHFLEWFENYLKTIDDLDPRVTSALRRALQPYRNPRIHKLNLIRWGVQKKIDRLGARLRVRANLRSATLRIRPPKPLILMYHRIAEETIDPWGLAVSPACFEQQLEVLRRKRHPLTLEDFTQRLLAGTLPPNAVALTFDDGYVDNLTAGKPLLAAADVPATVFLATGYLGSREPFWWDELTRMILAGDGPQEFDLNVGEGSFHFDRGEERSAREICTAFDAPSTRRHDVLSTLWQVMRRLGVKERRSTMERLRSTITTHGDWASQGRAMTSDEVRTLIADSLVTIGAHTVTHPVLAGPNCGTHLHEITESKVICEALSDKPVTAFAYPYGEFDAMSREAVKVAGLSFACSTRSGPVIAESDVLALPRVYVPNVDGDKFEGMLRWAAIET